MSPRRKRKKRRKRRKKRKRKKKKRKRRKKRSRKKRKRKRRKKRKRRRRKRRRQVFIQFSLLFTFHNPTHLFSWKSFFHLIHNSPSFFPSSPAAAPHLGSQTSILNKPFTNALPPKEMQEEKKSAQTWSPNSLRALWLLFSGNHFLSQREGNFFYFCLHCSKSRERRGGKEGREGRREGRRREREGGGYLILFFFLLLFSFTVLLTFFYFFYYVHSYCYRFYFLSPSFFLSFFFFSLSLSLSHTHRYNGACVTSLICFILHQNSGSPMFV